MEISVRKITFIGLFIALSIVLTRLVSVRIPIGGVEGIRIGFGKLPIVLGGFVLGPLSGAFIGALSDFLGYLIQPIGPYMPHFTVISAISGFLPVLLLKIFSKDEISFMRILFSLTISFCLTDLFLIPYALHALFDIPWKVLIIPRLFSIPLTIFLYSNIIYLFSRRKRFFTDHLFEII